MVKPPANSNSALPAWHTRDPVKQSLWDTVTSLGATGLADFEAGVDRQLAEALAIVETRRPGALALGLVAFVDRQPGSLCQVPPAVTGGKSLLRERMAARGDRYHGGDTVKSVWPEIRDQVLVQATLYFARIAAGHRFVSGPSTDIERTMRVVEKLWFMLRVLDHAEFEPTGYFDRSVWTRRPGFQK